MRQQSPQASTPTAQSPMASHSVHDAASAVPPQAPAPGKRWVRRFRLTGAQVRVAVNARPMPLVRIFVPMHTCSMCNYRCGYLLVRDSREGSEWSVALDGGCHCWTKGRGVHELARHQAQEQLDALLQQVDGVCGCSGRPVSALRREWCPRRAPRSQTAGCTGARQVALARVRAPIVNLHGRGRSA
jgi:hypothetical protein